MVKTCKLSQLGDAAVSECVQRENIVKHVQIWRAMQFRLHDQHDQIFSDLVSNNESF